MTASDLRLAMTRLGWTAERVGAECGVSGRQVRNWLLGKYPVPKLAAERIEGLVKGKGF